MSLFNTLQNNYETDEKGAEQGVAPYVAQSAPSGER